MMKTISERIRFLRLDMGLSQTKLAKELGVSQDTVSLWERGKSYPDAEMIIKLARFFNVPSDYILGLED